MTFLNFGVLAGLGAIAAPILIHLLNKVRVKIIKWGAMRFLQESVRKNQRRLQMEDLLLLLLRCLVIGLLAFAFARPILHPEATGAVAGGGPVVSVLIVDESASMSQSNGVNTRFENAKAAVDKVLDGLPASSEAALYLVTDRVNQMIPRPSSNLALVRRSLEVAGPTYRTSDLLPAIRLALDTLQPITGSKKEIFIFTDNQAVAWKQIAQIKTLVGNTNDVDIKVVPAGEEGENNLAITAMKPEAMVPATGQVYGVNVEVTNFGTEPVSGVRTTLSLDNDPSSDEGVIDSIPAGLSRIVRLSVKFPQPGYHTLSASIPPDRMPSDNQRAIAVQVVDQMKTAVVEGTVARSKMDRDGYFLVNALVPVAPSRRADYFLKVDAVQANWLEDADLSREEMIFLANVATVSNNVAQKLQKYVNDGGALIIFPGPNTQIDSFNTALKGLLPAKLNTAKDPGKSGLFASWVSSNLPHPVTSLWNDPKNGSLSSVRATKYYPLTIETPQPAAPGAAKPASGDAAQPATENTLTVVKYNDGTPAVVEAQRGRGHVVLFSTTANTTWNNFPIHPAFVPFLQRLTGYVSRRESAATLQLLPGAVYQHPVASDLIGRDFSVIRPDSKGKPTLAGKVELFNRQAIIRYRDTELAGAYRVVMNGQDRPLGAFAVQMDPEESNLKTVSQDDLASINKGDTNAVATAPAAGTDTKATGTRRELWGIAMWAVAIFAVAEMLLAHKFSISR